MSHSSNSRVHWFQIIIMNIIIIKKFEMWELLKFDTETWNEKCCWKKWHYRYVWGRAAGNLRFVKKAVSAKCSKTSCASTSELVTWVHGLYARSRCCRLGAHHLLPFLEHLVTLAMFYFHQLNLSKMLLSSMWLISHKNSQVRRGNHCFENISMMVK